MSFITSVLSSCPLNRDFGCDHSLFYTHIEPYLHEGFPLLQNRVSPFHQVTLTHKGQISRYVGKQVGKQVGRRQCTNVSHEVSERSVSLLLSVTINRQNTVQDTCIAITIIKYFVRSTLIEIKSYLLTYEYHSGSD